MGHRSKGVEKKGGKFEGERVEIIIHFPYISFYPSHFQDLKIAMLRAKKLKHKGQIPKRRGKKHQK